MFIQFCVQYDFAYMFAQFASTHEALLLIFVLLFKVFVVTGKRKSNVSVLPLCLSRQNQNDIP